MTLTVRKRKPTTQRLSDQSDSIIMLNNLMVLGLNQCFSAAGTALATTTTKVKTVNTITYSIDGALKTKAGTDNFWTLSGTTIAANAVNKYLLYIDSAGAASVAEGTQASTAASVVLPALAQSKAVVGFLTVSAGASVFTPGTTALTGGTVTVTYTDGLPPDYFFFIGDPKGNIVVA